MELTFLGTGAGSPTRQRNVTSIALELLSERGSYWLFDCGEGTQHQIMNSDVKLSKVDKLFVTHLHGDHIYGIPGLLTSRSYQEGNSPFALYGPKGIEKYIRGILNLSQARLSYPLEIIEIDQGLVFEDDQFLVETAKVDHRIESFGYRIVEKDICGKLDVEKLQLLGVPSGPIYGQLKQGNEVTLPDGRLLKGNEFVGPPIPGRKVAIIGDTRFCNAAIELAEGVDVLVHEATFAAGRQDLAERYYHATSIDAANVAKTAKAKALIATHISSRYQGPAADVLLQEAQQIFPNSHIAYDFFHFPILK